MPQGVRAGRVLCDQAIRPGLAASAPSLKSQAPFIAGRRRRLSTLPCRTGRGVSSLGLGIISGLFGLLILLHRKYSAAHPAGLSHRHGTCRASEENISELCAAARQSSPSTLVQWREKVRSHPR